MVHTYNNRIEIYLDHRPFLTAGLQFSTYIKRNSYIARSELDLSYELK
jgi:hypothetical protein